MRHAKTILAILTIATTFWSNSALSQTYSPSEMFTMTSFVATSETTAFPTVSPSNPQNLGCGCNSSTLWLDIIFAIDSSTAMTANGLSSLLSYLITAGLQMTISQNTTSQTSRIGVVTYSKNAVLKVPLTQFTKNEDLYNLLDFQLDNVDGSNIEEAIRLAINEFDRSDVPNRKKVLLIAASHYETGAWNDPTQAAAVFRGNGGNIITLEYVQTHGARVPILEQLASNCSTLSNSDEDLHVDALIQNFCRANCFCPSNWDAYTTDQKCYTPNGGCYFPVTIPAAQVLAQRYCQNQNHATLPTVCDANKAVFLNSLLKNQNEAQWTGLKNQDGSLTWDDHTPYNNCPVSNPGWLNETAQNGQCVAQIRKSGFVSGFFGATCFKDYLYTCQNAPCSSTLFCSNK